MSFEACESSNLMHSVPFPRFGISGAMFVVMSYFIDFLLFRRNKMSNLYVCNININYISYFFEGMLFFHYIYNYLYIN